MNAPVRFFEPDPVIAAPTTRLEHLIGELHTLARLMRTPNRPHPPVAEIGDIVEELACKLDGVSDRVNMLLDIR